MTFKIQIVDINFTYLMANSADPDQLASSEANWSGSTLFAKVGPVSAGQGLKHIDPDMRGIRKLFSYLSTKTYVVGTH